MGDSMVMGSKCAGAIFTSSLKLFLGILLKRSRCLAFLITEMGGLCNLEHITHNLTSRYLHVHPLDISDTHRSFKVVYTSRWCFFRIFPHTDRS